MATARDAGIATEVVDHKAFGKDRDAFDQAMQKVLEAHRIDLVCLAGFMRLLSPGFVAQWNERMLNIHPALLPAFKGLDTHKRALEAGAKIHGATVHFVVPEMDAGPIILQGAVAMRDGRHRTKLSPRACSRSSTGFIHRRCKLVAEGRVRVVDGKCLIDGAPVPDATTLTPQT